MAEREMILITPEQLEVQKTYAKAVRELPHAPKSYYIVTYGCQMNAHDSETYAAQLEEMGMTEAIDRTQADFVLFNTCCVRDNAERRALGNVTWLKEVRKTRPQLIIAVCGCMVQKPGMAEEIMRQYRFIDLAFGTSNGYRLPEMLWQKLQSDRPIICVEDGDTLCEGLPAKRLRKEAAYINVMYGCNNFCSYCIVPYVRGRERSREMADILLEAEQLKLSGVKEIMLLGQNVNSYGRGLERETDFATLLREVDKLGIERIRFMTSHPKDLSDKLIQAMADCKHVLPQFHLPVQSGNDIMLREMNRHYDRAQYLGCVKKLRSAVPGISLTTDIIVAYPGETEEMFLDTMSLVDEVGYDGAFTFIYSPRSGTAAAKLTDKMIPADVATERIERLIALQDKRQKEEMARFVGTTENVLVESLSRRSDTQVSGKGEHGVSITVAGSEADIGEIVKVKITEQRNNTLVGVRVE